MDGVLGDTIKLFCCNANRALAEEIAAEIKIPLGDSEVTRFSDGEICLRINEMVRGSDVFIIQPTCPPVNENIMELLIMIDALRRSSAGRITAVMPYFGYARQDRKSRSRDPISAKLVADLITTAGADRLLTMDLHCDQIQGFFDIPVDHLRGLPILAQYYRNKFPDMTNIIAVSPDLGSVARVRLLAERLDIPIAIVDKRRPKPNTSEVLNIIGNIEGKTAIILDDMIDTGGSITGAAAALMDKGAKEIYACCTHGVFSGPALKRIDDSPIVELVSLNTVPLRAEGYREKHKVLSVAKLMGNAIKRIHDGRSISQLFE